MIRGTDRLRMALLLFVRRINQASIERWSGTTFRRLGPPSPDPLDTVSAGDLYRIPGVPPSLHVPRVIPRRLRLGRLYELACYLLAGVAFKLYRKSPIAPDAAWDPSVHLELRSDEGWDDIIEDRQFAQLRVQGSNPYLLARGRDAKTWVADYTQPFRGIHEPVVCEFVLTEEGLRPASVQMPEQKQIGDA